MRVLLRSLALLAVAAVLPAQARPSNTIALTHANVVDGATATVLRDATILITNGRIR
jgi:hypothetical protein